MNTINYRQLICNLNGIIIKLYVTFLIIINRYIIDKKWVIYLCYNVYDVYMGLIHIIIRNYTYIINNKYQYVHNEWEICT